MSTLYEYYNTGNDAPNDVWGSDWYDQAFTPSVAHKITSVKLLLYRVGSPGTVTVSIRATTDGLPSGDDLCSGTTTGNDLTEDTAGEWREITLGAGYDLVASTQYAIVVRAPGGDVANRLEWRFDDVDATYAGGNAAGSGDSGDTWEDFEVEDPPEHYDFMFEEWGVIAYVRETDLTMGLGLSVDRDVTFGRTTTKALGLALSVSRAVTYGRTATKALGLALSVVRSWGRARTASLTLGLALTASRVDGIVKSATLTLGLKLTVLAPTIYKIRNLTVRVITSQYRHLKVMTSMYRQIKNLTSQYRHFKTMISQYRHMKTTTSMYRKIKTFLFGG